MWLWLEELWSSDEVCEVFVVVVREIMHDIEKKVLCDEAIEGKRRYMCYDEKLPPFIFLLKCFY